MVAWWPGDGFAYDVVGTNHATLLNGAGYATGEVGQAFRFDGSGAFVALPANLFPFPTSGTATTPFAFELWFQTTNGGVILGQQTSPPFQTPAGFVPGIYLGTDKFLRVEMFWTGSGNPITTTNNVADGNFHHLAVTYDGTNQVVWLDGAIAGSKP